MNQPARLLKEYAIAQAEYDTSQWPQYRGHWDGPEWRLVQITRSVRTKMGVAFEPGDVTVARANEAGDRRFITAYSHRTRIDTSIPANRATYLEDIS